jgi:hypothetical protein
VVPVAKYQGTCTSQEGQALIGTTYPFTDPRLHAIYPTFAVYRARMCRASRLDVRRRTLLTFDARDVDERVRAGRDRWPDGKRGNGGSAHACRWLR